MKEIVLSLDDKVPTLDEIIQLWTMSPWKANSLQMLFMTNLVHWMQCSLLFKKPHLTKLMVFLLQQGIFAKSFESCTICYVDSRFKYEHWEQCHEKRVGGWTKQVVCRICEKRSFSFCVFLYSIQLDVSLKNTEGCLVEQ